MDGQRLKLADGSFDRVLSNFGVITGEIEDDADSFRRTIEP